MARRDRDDDDDRGRSRGRGEAYVYKKRDAASVRKRAEQQGGNFDNIFKDGVKNFKTQQGDNTIRIMPPTWEDAEHYGYDVWVHYSIGADKGTYLCPKKMKNKPCPICDAVQEMKSEGEAEAAKRIEAKRRVLVYLIDREQRKPTPMVWAMPWTVDRDIAGVSENKKTGAILAIDDPKGGYDVSFRIEGSKRNTKYGAVAVDRESSPLSDDKEERAEWLELIAEKPLPKLLKYHDEEYLQKVVDGHSSAATDDDEDEDDGRKKKKKRGRDDDDDDEDERPRKKKRSRDDDDDEDEDERPRKKRRDDDDDDDEDDRPRKKRRPADDDDEDEDDAPKKKKRGQADDDDDTEDDDDDDDRPRKKKRARDDDDEDEDDEPAPKKKKKPADDDDEDEDDEPKSKSKRTRTRARDDDDDD